MHEWYHHDRIKIPVSRFPFRFYFFVTAFPSFDKFIVFTGYENMRRALFTSLIFNEMQQRSGERRRNEQAQIYKILQEFLLK